MLYNFADYRPKPLPIDLQIRGLQALLIARRAKAIEVAWLAEMAAIDAARDAEMEAVPVAQDAFKRLVRDESGVSAIEYGLIAALIAVVIIVAVGAVGTALSATFSALAVAMAG